ncbi:MAG TPA: zf-HC2 domain-containing protein [Jiangellaceae bacterium]
MKHLGERVTALVDEQLDHDDRDVALAHLARCSACQAAVAAERGVADMLRNLPDIQPSERFVQMLHELPGPDGPLPPDRTAFPGSAPAPARWRPAAIPAGSVPQPREPHIDATPTARRSGVRYALAGSVSLGVLAAALASLGAEPEDPVVPPMQQFTVEHARSSGALPFADPSAVVVPASSVPQDP